jgi:hypothetical protein
LVRAGHQFAKMRLDGMTDGNINQFIYQLKKQGTALRIKFSLQTHQICSQICSKSFPQKSMAKQIIIWKYIVDLKIADFFYDVLSLLRDFFQIKLSSRGVFLGRAVQPSSEMSQMSTIDV